MAWDVEVPGVVTLPSGRHIRGRGLSRGPLSGPAPEYGLYLLGRDPRPFAWTADWVRWPDFRLPADRGAFARSLCMAYERTAYERVELACSGGRGRTGTALACAAVLDGVPAFDAVQWVREHYDRRAVETPWQRRFVTRFRS